jgi:hypothetical protein
MDVIGVPTEAQVRRMQGIIAMLQSDKSALTSRAEAAEAQLASAKISTAKLARQAEEAAARADQAVREKNELQADMQVGLRTFRAGWRPAARP